MKVFLKKDWRSPKGKLYPSGSYFEKDKNLHSYIDMTWYNFIIPGESYGIVLLPDSLLRLPTQEEIEIKKTRQKLIDEHIEATKDAFLL